MSLCKRWRLNLAPINCRQSIFKRIRLIFDQELRIVALETAGSICGTYTITNDLITIDSDNFWYCRGTMWAEDVMYDEADTANNFIHSLIEKPFKYELKDDMLIVFYDDQEFQFKEYV